MSIQIFIIYVSLMSHCSSCCYVCSFYVHSCFGFTAISVWPKVEKEGGGGRHNFIIVVLCLVLPYEYKSVLL